MNCTLPEYTLSFNSNSGMGKLNVWCASWGSLFIFVILLVTEKFY